MSRLSLKVLDERLKRVEETQQSFSTSIDEIKASQAKILTAVDKAQGIYGFAQRHFAKVAFAAVGAGMFNPTASKFISALLG